MCLIKAIRNNIQNFKAVSSGAKSNLSRLELLRNLEEEIFFRVFFEIITKHSSVKACKT